MSRTWSTRGKFAGRLRHALVLAAAMAASAVGAQTLNVYTAWPESLAQPLFDGFTQQTGIKIDFIRMSSGEMLTRATAERNNPRADVMFGGPGDTYAAAKEAGILEPYKPASWDKIPDHFKDKDGYYVGFAANLLVFMTNNAFLKEKGLKPPTSWADLLDPAYKGQIQTADARTSGTAITRILSIYYAMGSDEAKLLDYQKKLHANIQSYTKAGGGGTVPVAMGQAATGIFHIPEAMATRQKGYDVVITTPREGVAAAIEAVAIIKNPKNRELARKFVEYAASPAMQNLFAKHGTGVLPTHPDAIVDPTAAELARQAKFMRVDLDWVGKNRKRLVEQWVNEVIR
ncbi:MAG: ABC transporter substrate-binding protein [Burkholderiales bacterium]|nr:ABC transporter substrate-binding protein [Burkholderiales bacterium]